MHRSSPGLWLSFRVSLKKPFSSETALDPRLATRFDYDAILGTVLNRFVIQAVLREPLTVYGSGGQMRGIIDIRDTVECLRLTTETPAERGEYRVFNQLTELMTVADIAKVVATTYPEATDVEYLDNPRVEAEDHYYNVTHQGLVDLGLDAHLLSTTLIDSMFAITERHRHRVNRAALRPLVDWRQISNPIRAT